jgi:hypothetical protein
MCLGTGWRFLVLALLPVVIGPGCESMSNTDKGVLGGGAIGAGLGALIGGPRHAGAGALIGGVTGAAVGGIAGADADARQKKQQAAVAAAQQRVLSLPDIVEMTRASISDDVIINQVRLSGAMYNLTATDLLYLQNNGVHEVVIRELQATVYRGPRRVYTEVPVAAPVYVVEPAPPPPSVGVGVAVIGTRRW